MDSPDFWFVALPSSTRAVVSAMVEANGALSDDVQVNPFDELMADVMDWVDEDAVGLSAEGGELDTAVCAAYEHVILS